METKRRQYKNEKPFKPERGGDWERKNNQNPPTIHPRGVATTTEQFSRGVEQGGKSCEGGRGGGPETEPEGERRMTKRGKVGWADKQPSSCKGHRRHPQDQDGGRTQKSRSVRGRHRAYKGALGTNRLRWKICQEIRTKRDEMTFGETK